MKQRWLLAANAPVTTLLEIPGLQIRISVELALRASPNFRTSFFVEIANFTELSGKLSQFLGKCCILGKSRKILAKHFSGYSQNAAFFFKFLEKVLNFDETRNFNKK